MTKRKLNIHSACYHYCHSAVPGTFSKSAGLQRAAGENIMTNNTTADSEQHTKTTSASGRRRATKSV